MPVTENDFMVMVNVIAARSTCSRLKVGAMLVRDRRPISIGYNGAPANIPHCYHREEDERPCEKAVHAEMNTIAFAAKNGIATDGATLYITHEPCLACAQLIINAGIKRVVWESPFRDHRGMDLLREVGIEAGLI